MSRLIRAISENGGVIFSAIDSTEIVAEMERVHKTSAVTSAALGRLLTAGALMGAMLKSPDNSITLRVSGDGPAGLVLAVADGAGPVKGWVENPVVELPLRADGNHLTYRFSTAGKAYLLRIDPEVTPEFLLTQLRSRMAGADA